MKNKFRSAKKSCINTGANNFCADNLGAGNLDAGNSRHKKRFSFFKRCVCSALICTFLLFSACGGENGYVLTEETFFLVMTNAQYYSEQYVGKNFEYDCFIYDLTDVNGKTYRLGVRKCSAGWGCKCGKDTIIGFILNNNGETIIPEPKNQNENTPDKAWVHLKGEISSANKTCVNVYAVGQDGEIDKNTIETVYFLSYNISEITVITDYSKLNYYVEK